MAKYQLPPVMNLLKLCEQIKHSWVPHVVGELNGHHVKVVKLEGAFVWHQHAAEDELFLVIQGAFRMHYRNHDVLI